MTKGQQFYELADTGLSNVQIAAKLKTLPHVVGARMSEYRKTNNLPPPRRSANNWSFLITAQNDEAYRIENLKTAERDENGVLVCPPRYAEGYGME